MHIQRFIATWLCVAVGSCASASILSAQNEKKVLSERERALHLASRLTFGPTPQLIAEIEQKGVDAWLEEQLAMKDAQPDLTERMSVLASLGMSIAEIVRTYDLPAPSDDTDAKRRERDRRREIPKHELRSSVIWRAVESKAQVAEVMAEFFRNHFNVDQSKDGMSFTAVEFERVVIRKHVFSPFHEILAASAKHPAMLIYLDNIVSRRPPTKTQVKAVARDVRRETGSAERGEEAARIAEQSGLNENYARELLELHTLGVDNGYTQKDVIAVAEALTGWTVDTNENRYTFVFDEDKHVEGDKFVLGKSVAREKKRNGIEEGEAIFAMLAQHPNTADFIAKKLCIYLVADDPPASLVEKVSREFKKTKGDMRALIRCIVKSDEFWSPTVFRKKFRTPLEFVAAAMRASGAEINDPAPLLRALDRMGQSIYGCVDPTGYRDTAESWRDPGVMTTRWQFAVDLAANRMSGIVCPDEVFVDIRNRPVPAMVDALARRILPAGLRSQTIAALIKIAAEHTEAAKDPKSKAATLPIERKLLGVLLGAPEFQEQ